MADNTFSIQTTLIANAGFRKADHWTQDLSIDVFPCLVSARWILIVQWEPRCFSWLVRLTGL